MKYVGTCAEKNGKKYLIEDIQGIKVAFLSYTYGTNAFFNKNYLKKSEKHMVNLFQEQELSNWLTNRSYTDPSKLYTKIYRKLERLLFPEQVNGPFCERKEYNRRCKKQLLKEIRDCKNNGADYIIMCMHAGGQYNDQPTKYTKKIADYLVKHGVDAIIGNHEHVVHNCDISQISNGIVKTYSLGNFSAQTGVTTAPFDKMCDYSIIFNLYLSKR